MLFVRPEFLRHQVRVGRQPRTHLANEDDLLGIVVVLHHRGIAPMVHVHRKSGEGYLARNPIPVAALGGHAEMAEARVTIGHRPGATLHHPQTRFVRGEIAEERAVEQVAGEIFLGQVGYRRGVGGIGLELFQLGLGSTKPNLTPFYCVKCCRGFHGHHLACHHYFSKQNFLSFVRAKSLAPKILINSPKQV